jgi:hypothetical protein
MFRVGLVLALLWLSFATRSVPRSSGARARVAAAESSGLLFGVAGAAVALGRPTPARAIGSLYELRGLTCVLQDVSFNVPSAQSEAELLRLLLQDGSKTLRGDATTTTVGFGPDAYKAPKAFLPGISPLSQYGGHATLTFKGEGGSFNPGNGLQYVKIGTEQLRISKGVDAGGMVKFAYGWIDMDTPGGVPLEVVVGVPKVDPLMLACIRCSSVADTARFLQDELGMSEQPFPYARQVGSLYEPQKPTDSVFLSYGAETFGLLLVPTLDAKRDAKKYPNFSASKNTGPINVGTVLDCFTIVVDDKKASAGLLPPAMARFMALASGSGKKSSSDDGIVFAPDGYRFRLEKYSDFQKRAVLSL